MQNGFCKLNAWNFKIDMIPESSSPCIEDNSNYPTYMLKCILPGLNSNLRIYDIEENPLLKAIWWKGKACVINESCFAYPANVGLLLLHQPCEVGKSSPSMPGIYKTGSDSIWCIEENPLLKAMLIRGESLYYSLMPNPYRIHAPAPASTYHDNIL